MGPERVDVERLYFVKKNPTRLIRKDTGQTITFLGLDDPRKHKSKKPAFGYNRFLWFEEADEFSSWDELENVMISYQRGGDAFTSFITYNPPRSSANWVNAEAAKPSPGRKVYHTDYRDILCMGWMPGKVLERIEHMRKTNFELYRHIYLGEQTGTGGEIFTNLKAERITDEQIAEWRRSGRGVSYGLDFGIVNDPTVLEGTYYDTDRDVIYYFDEAVLHHPYFTTVFDMLKRKGLERFPIIADTAPAGWIQNINLLGANLKPCYKAPDWPEIGVNWMRSRTRMVLDPERCPLAWEEHSHYASDTYKDGSPKERLPDRDNHSIDSGRMSREADIKASAAKKFVGAPKAMARRFGSFG
jgi:phage terminase large subunit